MLIVQNDPKSHSSRLVNEPELSFIECLNRIINSENEFLWTSWWSKIGISVKHLLADQKCKIRCVMREDEVI